MNPQTGQAAFRIGCFIVLLSAALLIWLRPGTAEFTITVFMLFIGIIFLFIVALVVRRSI
ncbi:hypothetical protein Tter_0900 [Thermobaculum terrenum ATCC BAA-798]|uniref:Uncharacterized protein n=1 Tax=Thermobaculum terrenum (strain ATCC BAA-798 / CCMEE 7001 / YNP1) TaxID=525904 RepID=D1CFW1_THET1|nr:hypothetical protein [Thermobaculum terrenum]ACZ41817.1 hypothetical protein Tter_0900 [Thermobaculum terrenum ATCC BAA-798]